MKTWIKTEVFNSCEQKLLIQPTPEFNGIEIYIQEIDNSNGSGGFYINQEELPIIIKSLQQLMEYVTSK